MFRVHDQGLLINCKDPEFQLQIVILTTPGTPTTWSQRLLDTEPQLKYRTPINPQHPRSANLKQGTVPKPKHQPREWKYSNAAT